MRAIKFLVICLSLLLSATLTLAQTSFPLDTNSTLGEPEFLAVEQAYQLNTDFETQGQLRLNWQITNGYYLYRHGFRFKLMAGERELTVNTSIPEGLKKEDEYFGLVEVYYHNIDIELNNIPTDSELLLTVTSQGCADAGLCYPPYSQQFKINGKHITPVGIDTPIKTDSIGNVNESPSTDNSLALMLLLAVLGGAILNLMPCVFPILSLKVLAFANDSEHSQTTHGLVYSAGVIFSFVVVAAILISLQAAGEAIGWGFHLQSPWFVATLCYLFFVMGLSLSGFIEFGGKLMNTGNSMAAKPGYSGSFFTGVLATVVASPCTAPFMGTALGFAVTQTKPIALLVFAALGLGMALPVLLLSYSPKLLKKIPRPGPWMEQLKQLLAFPLYITAVWLCWVVGNQVGNNGMAIILLGCVILTLALWLWSNRHGIVSRGIALICLILALGLLTSPFLQPAPKVTTNQQQWQAYTPQILKKLRQQGKPVFINITADWCITCLANEKVTLDTQQVKDVLASSGITYLKGDWTNHNPDITELLKNYGRTGIPLYIVYAAGNANKGVVLPQILTKKIVLKAIAEATKS